MPRVCLSLTENTLKQLRAYCALHHPGHKALSLAVEQAILEFLDQRTVDPRTGLTAQERRRARIKYGVKERKKEK